jgi:uncharacterized protein (TIGR03546 family)
MFFRKLAKIIRGKATPFQLYSACLLGSLLGFMPGFGTAGGLILALLLLLVILNANLAVAGLIGVAAKLASLLLMPASFALGRFLLDGPAEGLFRVLVNAPVFALFGFEYYATSGGLFVGLLFGTVAGWLLVRLVSGYRRKMKDLETNSELHRKYFQKRWVKLLSWLLLGGAPKQVDYDVLLAKKVGNPIRTLGAVFAAVSLALLVILCQFAAGPMVTAALRAGLETVNGATVDLRAAELDLKENRLTLRGLAMADPNALDTDLFRADELVADLSGLELLRKRLQFDQLKIVGASSGQKRAVPGHLVGKPPEPVQESKPAEIPNAKSIDDYLKNARQWKQRLAQVRKWLEKLGNRGGAAAEPKSESWQEQLAREVREKGYPRVRADHLIEGRPLFSILELTAGGVRAAQFPDDTLDITARNLSTQPRLLGKPPQLDLRSNSGNLEASLRIGQFASDNETNRLSLRCQGLAVNAVAGQLAVNGARPLSGGTMDLAFDGTFRFAGDVMVDLPLKVTLHHTTLQWSGIKPQPVERFAVSIGLSGPLDNPRVQIDDRALQDALVKAGVSRLKEEVGSRARDEIKKQAGEKIGAQGQGVLDRLLQKKD